MFTEQNLERITLVCVQGSKTRKQERTISYYYFWNHYALRGHNNLWRWLWFLGFEAGNSEYEFFSLLDGDNLENMEGVSLQAVTLADGSTAYIQHNSKGR